jgi:hypothetical protein
VTTPDREKERKRLAELYGGMSEGELRKLTEDARSLTEQAREALRSEIVRRGLDIAVDDSTAEDVARAAPVILRRFLFLPEALLAKSILDSADIECFLADEHTIRMGWFWSLALRGVKLWVRPEDADAGQLLDQGYVEAFIVEGVGEYKQPRCPECGSFDISFQELIKTVAYFSLLGFWLLGFVPPIPLKRLGWKCHACGHSWEGSSDPAEQAP